MDVANECEHRRPDIRHIRVYIGHKVGMAGVDSQERLDYPLGYRLIWRKLGIFRPDAPP